MPPRWPRKPDRADPAYRKLADRINLAVHVAAFAAVNSGLWFGAQLLTQPGESLVWPWLPWITGVWLGFLVIHGAYVLWATPAPTDQPSPPEP
ncbi:MAG: hypothetical protein IGQ88_06575 [Gloeomargaritaceae cyanobacterium C42_A2020_066]|nr:hypothetical protein [Gloeomargaritaceae cyanobacterium C42_A2020_066]